MDLTALRERILSDGLISTELKDGTGVLLNLGGMEILTFNRTGMLILQSVSAGVVDLEEIVSGLVRECDVDRLTAETDAKAFVQLLAAHLE